ESVACFLDKQATNEIHWPVQLARTRRRSSGWRARKTPVREREWSTAHTAGRQIASLPHTATTVAARSPARRGAAVRQRLATLRDIAGTLLGACRSPAGSRNTT